MLKWDCTNTFRTLQFTANSLKLISKKRNYGLRSRGTDWGQQKENPELQLSQKQDLAIQRQYWGSKRVHLCSNDKHKFQICILIGNRMANGISIRIEGRRFKPRLRFPATSSIDPKAQNGLGRFFFFWGNKSKRDHRGSI